jgi:hypothetical protein
LADEGPKKPVVVLAMVDSGAWRSSFPKQIAYGLGLTDADLELDPTGGSGVGSQFQFWTSLRPIRAGLAFFTPNPDGSERPWGPGFDLSPAFTEHDAFLLGRADFFAAFSVTFDRDANGVTQFHLDAPDVA